MKKLYVMILMLGTLVSTGIWAHDARLHQANATTGEVTSVASDNFDLKTEKGNVKVTFSSKTSFEHGGAKLDKSHLMKGDQVGVIGTKLPSGEIVAKEILLGVEESRKEAPNKGKAPTEHKH
jgi:hypothetical protein